MIDKHKNIWYYIITKGKQKSSRKATNQTMTALSKHFLKSDYIYSNILVFTFQVVFHKFLWKNSFLIKLNKVISLSYRGKGKAKWGAPWICYMKNITVVIITMSTG